VLAEGKISPEDLRLLVVTDSVEQAQRLIVDCYRHRCWEAQQVSEAATIQR
jgi:hypothetical protein